MAPKKTCEKCGSDLEWHEQHMVFWNKHLKKGYIKWLVLGSSQFGTRKDFPQYTGKKLCQSCAYELFNFGAVCPECGKRGIHKCTPDADKKLCSKCAFSSKTAIEHEKASGTNIMGLITGNAAMDISSMERWVCAKKFDINNQLGFAEDCSSYMTLSEYEKKRASGEIGSEPEPVEAVADFFSLKALLTKNGLIMSAFNCPKCSGMVDIPENGKVLICKHCGSPIKPVEILERIKSLTP
jgi:hypothetical protein